ncbi:MAG: YhfC family glutamic-type intramembrane protease [Myxococcota bacterium]
MTLAPLDWLALGFQAACFYVVPATAAVVLVRRLHVRWRTLGLGALTWLSALPFLIGVPLVSVALLAGDDRQRAGLVWGVALSLTAAVAEETSRYLWYRRAQLPDRRAAIVAGLGHGATEAFVLGLQFVVAQLVLVLAHPELLPPEAQDPHVVATWAWIGGASRLLFVAGHVGLTLLVWRAVRDRRPGGWLAAIGLHAALDLAAFVLPALVPHTEWAVYALAVPLAGWATASVASELRAAYTSAARPADTSSAGVTEAG